jgi:hypothetical protein
MTELKPISHEGIDLALKKAERYRLLNEPAEAESICLDVLAIDPDNQPALVTLLLALSDQFRTGQTECVTLAKDVLPKLKGEYERLYYAGIIWERQGLALATKGGPRSGPTAHAWLRRAMEYYEKAEPLRPPGNDDAILRWNTCVRLCQRYQLAPEAEEQAQPVFGDD